MRKKKCNMTTGSLQSIELTSWQARRQSYPLEFTTEKNFRGAFKMGNRYRITVLQDEKKKVLANFFEIDSKTVLYT